MLCMEKGKEKFSGVWLQVAAGGVDGGEGQHQREHSGSSEPGLAAEDAFGVTNNLPIVFTVT